MTSFAPPALSIETKQAIAKELQLPPEEYQRLYDAGETVVQKTAKQFAERYFPFAEPQS